MIIFVEEILEEILKFYSFAMDEEAKQILFKVIHICLVIHAPHADNIVTQELTNDECDNMLKLSTANDTTVWFKQMRAILSIVEKEINEMRKQLLQRNQVSTLSTVFVNMAAKLCSMVCIFCVVKRGLRASGSAHERQKFQILNCGIFSFYLHGSFHFHLNGKPQPN